MAYVNYVREHMAFIEAASDKGLSGNERALWYALMHIANQRASGSDWPEDFISIPNTRLLAYVPFGESKIPEIRNRLKQHGLIDFRRGERNKRAPEYKIIYFAAELSTDYPQKMESCRRNGSNNGSNNGNRNLNLYRNPYRNPNAYEDDDNEEDEETRTREALGKCVDQAYRDGLHRSPLPIERQQLIAAALTYGMSESLTEQAIKRSALRAAKSPALYAAELMRDWHRRGVKTMLDLVERDGEMG